MARPAGKQNEIVQSIRTAIIKGRHGPGERLETREEIVRRFGASPATVQAAFDQLIRMGFARAQVANGTFVTDHPPHLHQYALAFYGHPHDSSRPQLWSRFYEALAAAAEAITHKGPAKILMFHDINGHRDSQDYHALVGLVRQECLAGIIFAASPHELVGTELLAVKELPRVGVMDNPWKPSMGMDYAVTTDSTGLIKRAIDLLASRGRKRLACLMRGMVTGSGGGAGPRQKLVEQIEHCAAAAGMSLESFHVQFVDPFDGDGVRRCVGLLFHSRPAERPDALLVGDDHLLDSAQGGLLDAGLSIPNDVEVASHWNFPRRLQRVTPVHLVGFDAGEILRRCMDTVDQLRRGRKPPSRRVIPAVTEEELAIEPQLVL